MRFAVSSISEKALRGKGAEDPQKSRLSLNLFRWLALQLNPATPTPQGKDGPRRMVLARALWRVVETLPDSSKMLKVSGCPGFVKDRDVKAVIANGNKRIQI